VTEPHAGPDAINGDLERDAPALFRALSDVGRRVFYPPGIPQQAAQARGLALDGTIGQITDGHGHALPLPEMEAMLAVGSAERLSRAFLYSPVEGVPELRQAWRARQRRGVDDALSSTLPLVTNGLTHGLSIVADLFAGPGRAVAVAAPFWGNYRQAFALRTGAEMRSTPAFREGRFNAGVIAEALEGVPAGTPAIAIVNAPSNPGGYMPTASEREALVRSLLALAEQRPLVVVVDDAYAGLVYDPSVPRGSLFWQLAGRHPNLVAVKIDGVTKELSFFGGRVGFLTFAAPADSALAAALASKVKSLVRSTVGSPVAVSQMVVLGALECPSLEASVEAVRLRLARRCHALQEVLAEADAELLRPWPFNAGCFAVIELPERVDAEALRQHLLARHETGIISIAPHHVRIAFCSLSSEAIPELVHRLERGVREQMKGRRPRRR